MSNSYFQFKHFTIHQDRCAMKVTTDACLFGAWAAEKIKSQKSKVKKILDIGTGTGLLTLMLAQKINASIDAIEIEQDAFKQAKENIAASPWNERINIFHADAVEFAFPYQYNIIVSNPPFYENELKPDDAKKKMAHHSGLALQQLLSIIKKNLSDDGQFYLLLPFKRIPEAGFLFQKNYLAITHTTFVKQSTQHDCFRVFISGKHTGDSEENYTKDEIAIANEKKEYTKEFTDLLKDYYLSL